MEAICVMGKWKWCCPEGRQRRPAQPCGGGALEALVHRAVFVINREQVQNRGPIEDKTAWICMFYDTRVCVCMHSRMLLVRSSKMVTIVTLCC